MNNASGIYVIKNVVNGKVYVGSALNIRIRWNQHKYELRHGISKCKHLQLAWNKHGELAFEFSILESVEDKYQLTNIEQHWINNLNSVKNGYNLRLIARSQLGMKHSEEAKKKMSESRKGQKRTNETREKMSAWQIGKTLSEETKKKISDKNRGRKRTAEVRNEMSESRIGRTHSDATKAKISKIFKGRVFSEETKKKISESAKARYKYLRENHPEKLKQSREHVEKRELARLATLCSKNELLGVMQ